MTTTAETKIIDYGTSQRIITKIYREENGVRKLFKQIVVEINDDSEYSQTIIKDKWLYTKMWYDNRNNCQHFNYEVITEGKDIGKLKGVSEYHTDMNRCLFKGIKYPQDDFNKMRLNGFR